MWSRNWTRTNMTTDTSRLADGIRRDADIYAAQFNHDGDREFDDVAPEQKVLELFEHGDLVR